MAGAGTFTGNRPGPRGPGLLLDMEIRYTLGREDHGIYTYAVFTHQPSYGATQLGESRYGMKLNQQVFDWLSIDAQRNAVMPNGHDWDMGTDLNMKEARRLTTGASTRARPEHKYDYCVDQFDDAGVWVVGDEGRMWGFTSSILRWSTCRAGRITLS